MRKSDRCHYRSLGETNVNFFCRVNKAKCKNNNPKIWNILVSWPMLICRGGWIQKERLFRIVGPSNIKLKMDPLTLCVTQKVLKQIKYKNYKIGMIMRFDFSYHEFSKHVLSWHIAKGQMSSRWTCMSSCSETHTI